MSISDLAKRHPFQLWGSLFGLVLLGYGFFRSGAESELAEEFETISKEANRISTNAVNSTGLKEQVSALKAANQVVMNRTAKASDLAGNTQYFYRLEAETGLKEISLSPVATKSGDKNSAFVVNAFTVTVQGRYIQILSFIQKLEGAAWFGRISSLNIRQSSDDKQNAEPLLTAVIVVELLAQR